MPTLPEVAPEIGLQVGQVTDHSEVVIVVPTCNARHCWSQFQPALAQQEFEPSQVLVIDSSSEDGTAELAAAEGYKVVRIERRDFNHGGTRQFALEFVPWAKFVVYLTQDAILAAPDSIDLLLAAFKDPTVGAAYGRQLPRPLAGPIESHARLFNYPAVSDVRDLESRHTLGIRAAFLSNSFSAYRIEALTQVGGFPRNVILSEDAIVTAKLLLMRWKAAYVAESLVYHSHEFTVAQEFRRYFDIGVAHSRALWLRDVFGKPRGEGQRFVRSEFKYLLRRSPHLIPAAVFRNLAKITGYKLGLREQMLKLSWCRKLSCHRNFWNSPVERTREIHTERSRPPLSSSQIPL